MGEEKAKESEPREGEEIVHSNEEKGYEIFKKDGKLFRRCHICGDIGGGYVDERTAKSSAGEPL